MAQIFLYGTIDNPVYNSDCLYIVKEEQISPSLYRYTGKIGYGIPESEFDSLPEGVYDETRVVTNPEFPIKYIPSDMRDFVFVFNKDSNRVVVECGWRIESNQEEHDAIKHNTETDHISAAEDDETVDEEYKAYKEHRKSTGYDAYMYPYFRFPRSKDGISVSRVLNTIFKDKDITIYLPKEYAG